MKYRVILKVTIFILCLTFVVERSVQCFTRFFKAPQAFEIRMSENADGILPQITFCPEGQYKQAVLEECGLKFSDLNSRREPKWIGEGAEYCKNPKYIMEKAKIHLNEIIEKVKIAYVDTNPSSIYPTNQSFWKFSDDKTLGSCHTFFLPKSHERKQIQKFEFVMKSSVYWKINSPGDINLRGGKYHYNISDRSHQKHNINYEVYHMLNYANDQPCVDDSYYEKDSCSDDLIFKESMEEVNCTWPFVKNKNHICTDKDSAIEAMEIGIDERRRPKCPNPCNYIKVITIPISKNRDGNFLKFFLPDSIKVHKAYYAYNEVSLIAEIGGYVGLFLGSSIYQITDLLDWLIDSWKRHQA